MKQLKLWTASALLALLSAVARSAPAPDTLVAATPSQAVIIGDTATSDANYAIGWSLVRVDSGKPAVDWIHYSSADPKTFLDAYDWDGEESTKSPYRVFNCVIDLWAKKILELPSTFPWWPGKNRGGLNARWSQEKNGVRYGLVENQGRFGTWDLWLVTINRGAMSFIAITPQLNQKVGELLQDKRVFSYSQYETAYPVAGDNSDSDAIISPASFGTSTATLYFDSDIPKSEDSSAAVIGKVVVRLVNGSVESVSSATPRVNPFKDDPALAQADQELNVVYARLKSRLDAKGRVALQKEQLAWIEERNLEADNAGNQEAFPNKIIARNSSLRATTLTRTAELRKRL